MDNRNHKRARTLILIPVACFVFTAICCEFSQILAPYVEKDLLYAVCTLAAIASIILLPYPCLAASIGGTVFAARATKEGNAPSRKFFVIGIIEIIACAAAVAYSIYTVNYTLYLDPPGL
ncbi:MAG: hypothetical protein ACSW8G_02310 [Bacillota bacterium]